MIESEIYDLYCKRSRFSTFETDNCKEAIKDMLEYHVFELGIYLIELKNEILIVITDWLLRLFKREESK